MSIRSFPPLPVRLLGFQGPAFCCGAHRYTDGDTPKALNILSGHSGDSAGARVPSGVMTTVIGSNEPGIIRAVGRVEVLLPGIGSSSPVASAYRLARRSMITRTNAASGTTYAKASRRSGFLTYIAPTTWTRWHPWRERKTTKYLCSSLHGASPTIADEPLSSQAKRTRQRRARRPTRTLATRGCSEWRRHNAPARLGGLRL